MGLSPAAALRPERSPGSEIIHNGRRNGDERNENFGEPFVLEDERKRSQKRTSEKWSQTYPLFLLLLFEGCFNISQ